MNDPNGMIFWRGRFHLFYQYNPNGAFHGTIHWGHAVSEDLLTWRHLPVALAPTPDSPDEDGCYSGCAFVDDDGTPSVMYTGVRGDEHLPCLARTTDPELLTTWEKYPGNPVIDAPPDGIEVLGFRDHCLWKSGESWYQVIGSGIAGKGGTALLYRSRNLTDPTDWEYLNPLHTGGEADGIWSGTVWECPDFFALGDAHVLVVSVWHDEGLHYSTFFVGDFDGRVFTPTSQGMMDFGSVFYAPQSLTDGDGRRVLIGWLRDGRDDSVARESGWSGAMSLPRLFSLKDGRLHIEPVPEVKNLRGERTTVEARRITPEEPATVEGDFGDALEVSLEFEPAGESPLLVGLRHASGETTNVICDPTSGIVSIGDSDTGDFSAASNAERVSEKESVKLRVFFDVSVVEAYFGDASCTSGCVYPENPAVIAVSVSPVSASPVADSRVSGDTRIVSGAVWRLAGVEFIRGLV